VLACCLVVLMIRNAKFLLLTLLGWVWLYWIREDDATSFKRGVESLNGLATGENKCHVGLSFMAFGLRFFGDTELDRKKIR
jgi:hypothetical protein